MEYWLQEATNTTWWSRTEDGPFDNALDALECRDCRVADERGEHKPTAYRVVDDSGNVLDYGGV